MQNNIIYLDNAATTKISKNVANAMKMCLEANYGNPSSTHSLGVSARNMIEDARWQIASHIGAISSEVYFTSGGTESNNWAIKGVISRAAHDRPHIITSAIEHPSVLSVCEKLESQGCEITYLPVSQHSGLIDISQLIDNIKENTVLVTIMYVNNEIGSILPIMEVGNICKDKNIIFHTDAVQAAGHLEINVNELNADLLSLSGHKICAPKGIGVLFVRNGIKIDSLINGGSQEKRARAGTENVMGIVGMGQAIKDIAKNMEKNKRRYLELSDYLIGEVTQKIPGAFLNGDKINKVPNIISFSFTDIEAESLLLCLDKDGICVSSGSACSSGSLSPSRVITAIGRSFDLAQGTIRISIGEETTRDDLSCFIKKLCSNIKKLRAMRIL